MAGSHLDCEADRDRAEVGVSMEPVDAARRAAGGKPRGDWVSSILRSPTAGIWMLRGFGRADEGPAAWRCPEPKVSGEMV